MNAVVPSGSGLNPYVRHKIRQMLAEDLSFGDLTTEALVDPKLVVRARIVCKERGVLAGVQEARMAFEEMGVKTLGSKEDGEELKPGDVVMEVEGPAQGVLKAERISLNLLMRMSGVATAARRMVEKAREVAPKVRVAATRKTLPLLTYFDKRAVVVGGGDPHRWRLDDGVLVKKDHLELVDSIEKAVKRVREAVSFTKKVEVEVTTAEQALEAARAGADIVMLDNVLPSEARRAVEELKRAGLRERVIVEVSGGITPDNLQEYARTGVDVVSSSYMTFRALAVDMSLEVEKVGTRRHR
ncbi:MAG: carboxylating nicotinate-nucleotide diphosphorylase [Candidatus Hadarchaeales archaeon]